MKSTVLLSLLALTASVLATPPACLLMAINTEQSPSDLNIVCGSDASKVQSAIGSMCSGDIESVAQSAFASTCSSAGKSVPSYTGPTNNGTTSATGSAASHASSTGTATGSKSASTASKTGSGSSASATGNVAAPGVEGLGSLVVAALAIAGIAVAL